MGGFIRENEPDSGSLRERGGKVVPEEAALPEGRRFLGGKVLSLISSWPVVTAALLLIGMVALAVYAGRWKKSVVVKDIVISGTSLVSGQEIASTLRGYRGKKLEEVSTEEITRKLALQPYIRDMLVSKELNGIIRVEISERSPEAVTVFQGREMIIDSDGMLLPDPGVSARFHRLQKVYGITRALPAGRSMYRLLRKDHQVLDQLIGALAGSDYAGLLVREIHLSGDDRTWFMAGGSSIRFIIGNEGNFKEKLKKFEIFWQKVVAKKGLDSYESVDLRFRDRVFARESDIPVMQQNSPR
jgi:cell division protein FtsQ